MVVTTLSALGGLVGIGPSAMTPAARLDVIEETLGNAVQKLETVATNDNPNLVTYQGRGTTTGAATTTLHTHATATGQIYRVEFACLGICTGGAGCTAGDGTSRHGTALYKNVGGTLTEAGETVDTDIGTAALSATTCSCAPSGTDILVSATGAAVVNLTWHITLTIQNLGS